MTIIVCAVIFEVIIPTVSLTWDSYALTSEGRILFWLITSYVYSRRKPVFVRGLLLFLCLCQSWTVVIYGASAMGHEIPVGMVVSTSVSAVIAFAWFIFRDHGIPQSAIPGMAIDKTKNYILIRKPCPAYFKDVVLSFFGRSAGSVSVYLDGERYGFSRGSTKFSRKSNASIKSANKYAIEIDIENVEKSKAILDASIGSEYRVLNCNCVSVFNGLWKHIGLNLNPLQRIIPGLFVAKLARF